MARLFVQVLAIHNDANLAKSKNAKVGYNFLPKPSRKCQRRLNFDTFDKPGHTGYYERDRED